MSLTTQQTMSIYSTGKCRCSYCGRFRKEEDFPDQPAREYFDVGGMRGSISADPMCRNCIEKYKGAE